MFGLFGQQVTVSRTQVADLQMFWTFKVFKRETNERLSKRMDPSGPVEDLVGIRSLGEHRGTLTVKEF